MTTSVSIGRSTGGKPINLHQLEGEIATAGVSIAGLGMEQAMIYTYDSQGQPADFAAADQATVDQAIADHVALRDKTDAEYATEFQDSSTTAARRQEIRDITAGLLPREQVPISQEEWDTRGLPV